MAKAVPNSYTSPSSSTPCTAGQRFCGESPKPTGPRYGRAVLQLHPALDLLHHGPDRNGLRVLDRWTAVHEVLMLGEVYTGA